MKLGPFSGWRQAVRQDKRCCLLSSPAAQLLRLCLTPTDRRPRTTLPSASCAHAQPAPPTTTPPPGDYAYYEGGEGEEGGGAGGGGLYAPAPLDGAYHGGFSSFAHLQHQRPGIAGAGGEPSHGGEGGEGGEEGEEEWGDAGEGEGRADSYGLPSEASLFRDLPDFLRDTTDDP